MGICESSIPVDPAVRKESDKIDKSLKENKQLLQNENKLLLLGPGESGKSTIVKQLRILNDRWITDEERVQFKGPIHSNAILSMGALIKALEKTNEINQLTEDQKEQGRLLMSPEVMASALLTPEVSQAIKELWALTVVKERFSRKSDVQIIDSADYFFDNIDRLSGLDYLPLNQDILFLRVRTTGITEFCFHLAGTPIRLVDVGGQRSERRKWIHCFEGVTALFFIVAISEFDQTLREDETANRLLEAFSLFGEVCLYETFRNTSIILFLNKSDLFEKKLPLVSFAKYIQDYKGENDAPKIYSWLRGHFSSLAGSKEVFSHITNATNTENVETVFGAVQKILFGKVTDQFIY